MSLSRSMSCFSRGCLHHNRRALSSSHHKYESNTNVDYETYFKKYPSEANINRTQFIRNKVSNEYLNKNKLGNKNYFEIGFGSGATIDEFGPYFDNLILLEPNPNYITEVDGKLRRNENIKQYRFIDQGLNEDWNINDYFSEQEIKEGMNLIIASHCLWYIKPNSWHNILNKLYNLLSNDNGMLVITMTSDESVSGSIYRTIEPKFQMAHHIIEYFENHKDYGDGKLLLDVWKEQYESEAIESIAISQLLFYAKTLVAPYDGHQYKDDEQFNNLYWDIVAEKFKEAGFYTHKIDGANIEIVNYQSIQSHIVVWKA